MTTKENLPLALGLSMRQGGIALTLIALVAAGCVAPAVTTTSTQDASVAPFTATDVYAGTFDKDSYRTATRGPFASFVGEMTLVPSELDGEDIMIYVMRPDTDERVPVILDAGPYFEPVSLPSRLDSDLYGDIVSHGFAFAFLAVRGTGDSGGCMDLMGPAERHDIDQGITWLSEQPWSNGNVGMFGGSYDGSTQWEAASMGNPALKTIAPIAGIPDLYSFMVWNGSWMAWTPAQFGAIYWGLYGPIAYNPATGRSAEHVAGQIVCPESMKAMTLSVGTTATGERDPLDWWATRDWRDDVVANYDGSVYLIHGFRDGTVEAHNAYPLVKELEAKGLAVKHTLGPWGHELSWRGDALEALLQWYTYWLKPDAAADIGPRAQIMDNLGMWRSETAWPPADAAPTTLHLTADGALSPDEAAPFSQPVAPLVPVHDPVAFAQRFNAPWKLYEDPIMEVCPQCPTFTTGTLDAELRFAGAPTLTLDVTPMGPGGHITAVLRAVQPDGTEQLVTYGIMDFRFADGSETARPVVPRAPLTLMMELQPADAVVQAGGELVLTLHQGGVMLRMPTTPTFPATVEGGVLTLATFVRGADAFHTPPPIPGGEHPPR